LSRRNKREMWAAIGDLDRKYQWLQNMYQRSQKHQLKVNIALMMLSVFVVSKQLHVIRVLLCCQMMCRFAIMGYTPKADVLKHEE